MSLFLTFIIYAKSFVKFFAKYFVKLLLTSKFFVVILLTSQNVAPAVDDIFIHVVVAAAGKYPVCRNQ